MLNVAGDSSGKLLGKAHKQALVSQSQLLSRISARVMRNEGGESRGFGFVSYQTPDQGIRAELRVFRVHY